MNDEYKKSNSNLKLALYITMGVVIIILVSIGIALAFLLPQGEGVNKPLEVTTEALDNLILDKGSSINLSLNTTNLAKNGNNVENTTWVKATLSTSKGSTVTYPYWVYFEITENTFTYTVDNTTPELILKVSDPSGNAVTSITGLTYNSTLQGFDITTQSGTFLIAEDSISTSTSAVEQWNFEIDFINLDTNQKDNAGASIKTDISIESSARNLGGE